MAVPPVDGVTLLSELQLRKLEEAEERRQLFKDFDPVPTGDQRAFDDRYFHFDEEEWRLMARLDPRGRRGGEVPSTPVTEAAGTTTTTTTTSSRGSIEMSDAHEEGPLVPPPLQPLQCGPPLPLQ